MSSITIERKARVVMPIEKVNLSLSLEEAKVIFALLFCAGHADIQDACENKYGRPQFKLRSYDHYSLLHLRESLGKLSDQLCIAISEGN